MDGFPRLLAALGWVGTGVVLTVLAFALWNHDREMASFAFLLVITMPAALFGEFWS
jgi:hypothetical protein